MSLLLEIVLAAALGEEPAQKLEPALRELVNAEREGGKRRLQAQAAERRITLKSGRVAVMIAARAERVAEVRVAVKQTGGKFTSATGTHVYASHPVSGLSKLAGYDSVEAVFADRPEIRAQKGARP